MDAEEKKLVALWDMHDSQTKAVLVEGRMMSGRPQPVVGERITGVGDWEQAEIVEFQLKTVDGNVPRYDVYVKRLL